MRNSKGFTLVELMIVVAILGVLGAIAVPVYNGYVRDAKRSEARTNLATLVLLEEQHFSDNGVYVEALTTDALKAALPGFRPGTAADLYFDYKVQVPSAGNFIATATRKSDSSTLTINQDNVKTGW